MANRPLIRREKSDPDADMWHTLRLGAATLAVLLPVLLLAQWHLAPTPAEKMRVWLQEQLVFIQQRNDQ
ncbi:MAG: hypothetical protein ACRC14_01840 [Paracoccaceae bacterium]